MDNNSALWASWYISSSGPKPYRVFFAGDSGYQFHDSVDWPPTQSSTQAPTAHGYEAAEISENDKHPACPAFAEIKAKLGVPHALLLPVSVGATYGYVRSFTYLSDAASPFPHHNPGLTGAAHMPPWDAVRVLRTMTDDNRQGEDGDGPVAIAMHWGTFVPEPTEVLMTLGQLEWACQQQNVAFARSYGAGKKAMGARACFLALNHGQSVEL